MFYVKFLVALGINQAAVAEVTSENIQQTKNTSLAESVIKTFALNRKNCLALSISQNSLRQARKP